MLSILCGQQVELFPALRGGDVDWRTAANGGQAGAEYSAFLGDYAPVADRASQPAAAPAGEATADGNATPPQTTAAPVECGSIRSNPSQRRHRLLAPARQIAHHPDPDTDDHWHDNVYTVLAVYIQSLIPSAITVTNA